MGATQLGFFRFQLSQILPKQALYLANILALTTDDLSICYTEGEETEGVGSLQHAVGRIFTEINKECLITNGTHAVDDDSGGAFIIGMTRINWMKRSLDHHSKNWAGVDREPGGNTSESGTVHSEGVL